jgi:hypothetical protein
MTQETICPACGAPLVYSGNQAMVRCTFCGADLNISQEDGQARFQVLAQPGPQKETLDKPVEGAGTLPGGARVYPSVPTTVAANPEIPLPPQPVSSEAAVYPVNEERRGIGSVNRWVWVGIVILVGLTVLCACAILAVLAVLPARIQ